MGEEWGEGECGRWEHKYFKNAANLYSVSQKPQACVLPASRAPATPLHRTAGFSLLQPGVESSLFGGGNQWPSWGGDSPAGQVPLLVSSGQWVRMYSRNLAALGMPTMPDRHCREVEPTSFLLCSLSGPQTTLESCLVSGDSFFSGSYKGQCQLSLLLLFFQLLVPAWLGSYFLRPGLPLWLLNLLPYMGQTVVQLVECTRYHAQGPRYKPFVSACR